jgi:hypothetical protein
VFVTVFVKNALKCKRLELGLEFFPTLKEITIHISKSYYQT